MRFILSLAFIFHAAGYALAYRTGGKNYHRAKIDPWEGFRGFALNFLTPKTR